MNTLPGHHPAIPVQPGVPADTGLAANTKSVARAVAIAQAPADADAETDGRRDNSHSAGLWGGGISPSAGAFWLLLGVGVFVGWNVLYHSRLSPYDLAGDEAQYWDWSRTLDWSYYSKGPLVAWLIRGSTELLGKSIVAVRLPAILLSAGTLVLAYRLGWMLTRSAAAGLLSAGLLMSLPVFYIGGSLMTIDPAVWFFWMLATWLVAEAIFHGRRIAWWGVGAAVGLGFLAKYAAAIWPIGLLAFALLDPAVSKWVGDRRIRHAVAVAAIFMLPVILWNATHDWVSFRHVAAQTGLAGGDSMSLVRRLLGPPQMLVAQAGGVAGVPMTVLMAYGLVSAWRRRLQADRLSRGMLLLACVGGVFFAANLLIAAATKVQGNWPAPAYLSWTVLAAISLADDLAMRRAAGRRWGWAAAAGVMIVGVAFVVYDTSRFYPLMTAIDRARGGDGRSVRDTDPAAKVRGWRQFGPQLAGELASLGDGAFVLSDNYQTTAQAAFHTPGQPWTYYAGSRLLDNPKRLSGYDFLPGDHRSLDDPGLLGKNAVYIGFDDRAVRQAFDDVQPLGQWIASQDGVTVRGLRVWRGRGYKGMPEPGRVRSY